MIAPEQIEDMLLRTDFEALMRFNEWSTAREAGGAYTSQQTRNAWTVYKAGFRLGKRVAAA